MARSWLRKLRTLLNRNPKVARPRRRHTVLTFEPLEDRIVLDSPASSGQIFNLSSGSSRGPPRPPM